MKPAPAKVNNAPRTKRWSVLSASAMLVSLFALRLALPAQAFGVDDDTAHPTLPAPPFRMLDYGSDYSTQFANITGRLKKIKNSLLSKGARISADDMNWLLSLAETEDAFYGFRANAVSTLGMADRDPKSEDHWRISNAVYKILTTPDDPKQDLGGMLKSSALQVVDFRLPERRFLEPIKALIDSDQRRYIAPDATKAYISLSERFNGNDGGVKLVTFREQLRKTANEYRKAHGVPPHEDVPTPATTATTATTAEDMVIAPYVKSCMQSRKIADNDLNYLITHANNASNTPKLTAEYLSPFIYLDPKQLLPAQKEAITRCLEPLLTRDDSKTDPQGLVKSSACLIVSMAIPEPPFNKLLQPLLSDPREQVKSAAEEAIAAIKNAQ